MDTAQYTAIRAEVSPVMERKLIELHDALTARLPEHRVTYPRIGFDDVSRVSMEVFVRDTNKFVGIDFELRDGDMYEGEKEDGSSQGCGISLIALASGRTIANYSPGNYTPDVWTIDVQDLISRVENTPLLDFIAAICQYMDTK